MNLKGMLLALIGNKVEAELAKYKIEPAKLVAIGAGLVLAYNTIAPAYGRPQIPSPALAFLSMAGVWLVAHKKTV